MKIPGTVILDFAASLVNQRVNYILEDGGEHGGYQIQARLIFESQNTPKSYPPSLEIGIRHSTNKLFTERIINLPHLKKGTNVWISLIETQDCRFVPYTASETICHRWYLGIQILVKPGFGGLIQG